MSAIDKKGIAIFLFISVGASWLVEGILTAVPQASAASNFKTSCILIALLMTPAFAALVASIVRGDIEHPKLNMWPVPKYPALALAAVVPLLFTLVYIVTTLAGWTVPDWKLTSLHTSQYSVDPSFFLVAGFVLTVALGPTLFAAICAGTEFGWRAYLLPKVLPLGRVPAHLLVGFFTAVWALPLVSEPFDDPKGAANQFFFLLAICVVVSAFLDELWLRTRHTGLTAVCAGCFLCQATGMWQYVFSQASLPYGGAQGVVSIVVWLAAAVVFSRFPMPQAIGTMAPEVLPSDSEPRDEA